MNSLSNTTRNALTTEQVEATMLGDTLLHIAGDLNRTLLEREEALAEFWGCNVDLPDSILLPQIEEADTIGKMLKTQREWA